MNTQNSRDILKELTSPGSDLQLTQNEAQAHWNASGGKESEALMGKVAT